MSANRPNIAPAKTPLATFQNISTAASITFPPSAIGFIPGISYDISWTGTTTGTFAVQVSNTYQLSADGQSVLNAGNWTTLPPSSFTGTYPVPAGAAGNGFLDVVGTEAAWVQLVYTRTSGTGLMSVVMNAKVL